MYSVRIKTAVKNRYETVKRDSWTLQEAVLWAQGYNEAIKCVSKYSQMRIAIFFNERKVCEL